MKSIVYILALHTIAAQFMQLITYESESIAWGSFSLTFFLMYYWVARRPPLPKQLPIDKNNILLAFYRGDNGSFLMNFFSMVDEPVKSMNIWAGGYNLKLAAGKDTFQFKRSHALFRKMDDYLIIDTGVPATKDFIEEIRKCGSMGARRFGLRINCVLAIKDLLGLIGKEWQPKGLLENSPSGYLRRASRL